MKRLHYFALAASVSMATTGVLVACSSDDTIVTGENARGLPDANENEVDAAEPDGSEPKVDAGDDGGDAGSFTVEDFREQVAQKICNALTRCCFGNADVPQDGGVTYDGGSGSFDRAACVKIYSVLGFERSSVGLGLSSTDNVVVNGAKAADCEAKIDALACNLDGASMKTIRSSCFGALEGQVAQGATCRTSVECKSGFYCALSSDAGTDSDAGPSGTCEPLHTKGQPCSIQNTGNNAVDSTESEIACSSRGGGDTGLMCQSYDVDNGPYKTDRAQWTCQPAVANGKICNTTVSCAEGICDPDTYLCQPVLEYFNQFSCKANLH